MLTRYHPINFPVSPRSAWEVRTKRTLGLVILSSNLCFDSVQVVLVTTSDCAGVEVEGTAGDILFIFPGLRGPTGLICQ